MCLRARRLTLQASTCCVCSSQYEDKHYQKASKNHVSDVMPEYCLHVRHTQSQVARALINGFGSWDKTPPQTQTTMYEADLVLQGFAIYAVGQFRESACKLLAREILPVQNEEATGNTMMFSVFRREASADHSRDYRTCGKSFATQRALEMKIKRGLWNLLSEVA